MSHETIELYSIFLSDVIAQFLLAYCSVTEDNKLRWLNKSAAEAAAGTLVTGCGTLGPAVLLLKCNWMSKAACRSCASPPRMAPLPLHYGHHSVIEEFIRALEK